MKDVISVDTILTNLHQYNLGEDPITDEPFTAEETYAIYPELSKAKKLLHSLLISKLPEKKELVLEEPKLYQSGNDGSSPFYCSGCQMSEMKIMDNKEGDKYYCSCSYWTDPHNAYIDRSGGKWLGWKNKVKAQEYLDNLPIEEFGYNSAIDDMRKSIDEMFGVQNEK